MDYNNSMNAYNLLVVIPSASPLRPSRVVAIQVQAASLANAKAKARRQYPRASRVRAAEK